MKFPEQYPTKHYKMFYMLLENGFERIYIAKNADHSMKIFNRVCAKQGVKGLACAGYN